MVGIVGFVRQQRPEGAKNATDSKRYYKSPVMSRKKTPGYAYGRMTVVQYKGLCLLLSDSLFLLGE